MEHFQSPFGKEKARGPYKTFAEVIEICEAAASLISETHKNGAYLHYFTRTGA